LGYLGGLSPDARRIDYHKGEKLAYIGGTGLEQRLPEGLIVGLPAWLRGDQVLYLREQGVRRSRPPLQPLW
jgi:hypothetical protein